MIDLLEQHSFFSDKKIDSCMLLECQGYCNENYIVVADGVKYVIRKLLRTDIDRDFEWKVQKFAYAKGITAEPFLFDREHSLMVFEFLEGQQKNKLDKEELQILAKTLQKLHNIHIEAKAIELQTDTNAIDNYPKEYVLCHNDLNPQNIFFSDTVKLIDWEYAGVNDKYFDLACVCVEFELEDENEKYFLAQYFEPKKYIQKKLEAYKTVYIALCKQWFDENRITLRSQILPGSSAYRHHFPI